MVIQDSVLRLERYARKHDYKGYDPYDALLSPLFKLPVLKTNKWLRFGTQQFVKRFPVNIRPLLLVPKGLNPVSIGLFIQGYAYLSEVFPEKKEEYGRLIDELTQSLIDTIPDGFSGACWGYDFDWEARHAKIPGYQPTVVATGIVVNGLYEAWKITGKESLKELIVSSSDFVLYDLNRAYQNETFCFSYSPFDTQRVFNASMKGARLLAQVYSIVNDAKIKTEAGLAVRFVMDHQRDDGSWGYSLANKGGWTDNYHTGYILDCLDEYIRCCDDTEYEDQLAHGYRFYKEHFFSSDGRPAFYSDRLHPADCTAASQSLLTLTRFGDYEMAKKTANWTIQNMQANNGSFYFRRFKYYTIKTSFMRWSNAWMFAGMGYLCAAMQKSRGEI